MIGVDDFYDIDFSTVIIDREKSIIYLNEGQNLDYGGFLKGYLAEFLVKKIKLEFEEVSGIIINLGGDIYTEGLDKNGQKFVFNIYNPVLNNNDINVTLYNQGLATSGTYKRSWFNFGEKVHHILDIFGEKNPKMEIVSSSVICDSGGEAEAYTKVFMSMEPIEAFKLLNNNDLKFLIIKNNGEIIKNII
jgi:thiamine biosynthesis lipoprotein